MRTVIPIVPLKTPAAPAGESDGWLALSTLSEPRLSEMAENYRRLGYEVDVREVQRNGGGCYNCFDVGESVEQVLGTLYVRRKADTGSEGEMFP
jgi:hypothetical protein